MAKDIYGWTGKILRVNLSTKKFSVEPSSELVQKFIGGMGLGVKIMWDEIGPEVGPLDPENKLLFLTGPLTGSLSPTSGRMEVCTKAPNVDPPSCTRSGLGGDFGPEIKYAGYDAIIVEGKAEIPVIILINDKEVTIKDAMNLWGKDTYATQKEICKQYGSDLKSVCIGPAGENLVHFATISHHTKSAASKAGMGAVMGSKNLKAIAVKGSGGVRIAKVKEFQDECWNVRRLIRNHPVKRWTCQGPIDVTVNFAEKYRTRNSGCFACPVSCRSWIEVPGLEPAEMMCLGSYGLWLGGNEYDAWEANVLANKLGLCTYTLYDIMRWLKDCFNAGIINEKETEIPWSKFASSEFMNTFLKKVAYREGFGDIVADRASESSKKLGKKAIELHDAYFPAYSSSEHYSVRAYPEVLMQWATDNRDPLSDAHDWICLVYWAGMYWPTSEKGKLSPGELKERALEAWGSEKAADAFSYEHKAETTIAVQNMSRLKNSLVLCDWSIFPIISSVNTPNHKGDIDADRKLFCAATGIEIDRTEFRKIGERIFNLERAIVAREGRRKKDDTIKDYYFKVPEEEVAAWELKRDPLPVADRKQFEDMREQYYKARGFSSETGIPTKSKLEELDLSDVALELEKLKA